MWVLINFLCIFLDGMRYHADEVFFPFDSDNVDIYDFTEFLVYAIILPITLFGIFKIYKYLNKK